jgi:hypothetical protein
MKIYAYVLRILQNGNYSTHYAKYWTPSQMTEKDYHCYFGFDTNKRCSSMRNGNGIISLDVKTIANHLLKIVIRWTHQGTTFYSLNIFIRDVYTSEFFGF